jgi:hypothetical protein
MLFHVKSRSERQSRRAESAFVERMNWRIAKVRLHRYLGAFPVPLESGETWPPKGAGL